MIIDYSPSFKAKAMEVFPRWKQLHQAINYNDGDSVRIILGNIHVQLQPEEVIKAIHEGTIKSLYDRAQHLVEVRNLENMWYEEFDRSSEEIEQRNEIGKLEKELFG